MTTNFNMDPNKQGKNGWGLPFCDTIFSAILKANADTTVNVPATAAMGTVSAVKNKFMAVIACTPSDDVFIALNATAAVPVGNTFAATTSELVPNGYIAKMVKTGDVIHVISASTPSVTIAFYAIQE